MTNKPGFNRRQFLASTAAVASFTIIPRHVLGTADTPSANNKLNIASVGVGGMGFGDIRSVPTENVVALCDVDAHRVANAMKQFPAAKAYSDYRKMLDAEKSIDAVMIATPDHSHAAISMAALKMGKHVFCQKPLTRTVHEAIEIGKAAKAAGVATQMGNQGQASEGARLVSEFIWSGAFQCVEHASTLSGQPSFNALKTADRL
jgi:predicted dehydrogenase